MHPAVITQILAIYAISGCDTAAACYGIGKTTTVTIAKNSLGVVDVLWDDVVKETTEFMVAAYGGSGVSAVSVCGCKRQPDPRVPPNCVPCHQLQKPLWKT